MEVNINPGVKELPKVTILEQRSNYIKTRNEYSNGFIFISETTEEGINIFPNFILEKSVTGEFVPNFKNPNKNFVDII